MNNTTYQIKNKYLKSNNMKKLSFTLALIIILLNIIIISIEFMYFKQPVIGTGHLILLTLFYKRVTTETN